MSELNQFLLAFAAPWVLCLAWIMASDSWQSLKDRRAEASAAEKRALAERDYAQAYARSYARSAEIMATLQASQNARAQAGQSLEARLRARIAMEQRLWAEREYNHLRDITSRK